MRVLVTGGSGFIGASVTRQLLERGHEVALVLRPMSQGIADRHRIEDLLPFVTQIERDLSDFRSEDVEDLASFSPGAVIALGWSGVQGDQRNNPRQYVNTEYLCDLYRAVSVATKHTCRAFIGIGSQAEYAPSFDAIDEGYLAKPLTAYGAAKLAACILLNQMAMLDASRFCWVRLFAAYGPDDAPDWMIPCLIRTLLRGEIPALTECTQCCDYLHVRDAALAIVGLLESDTASGIYNLGSGSAPQLREVVELIRQFVACGEDLPLVGYGQMPFRQGQPMHIQANVAKLIRDTGWSPQISLAEGLDETVEWYRDQCLRGGMNDRTE